MLILPLTLTALALPSLGGATDDDAAARLCRAIVAAAELPTPPERLAALLPIVQETCDLAAATRAWAWPEPGAPLECERFERYAASFVAALAEGEPTAFELSPLRESAREVRFAFASTSTDTYVLELANERIVAWRRSGREQNELVGSAPEVLRRGGVEALSAWLALELERPTDTAGRSVERLWAGLIAAGPAGASFDERYARLTPLIDSTHHFESIASATLGKTAWDALDAESSERFVALFRELSIATYANRFDATAGLTFTVEGDSDWRRGIRKVTGTLRKKNGDRIAFEYWMQRRRGRWDVFNVVADGVSDLSLKKTEYAHVLEQGGLPRLLDELAQRIAKQRE